MDEVAGRLRTIPALAGRVFAYPPDTLDPPALIVSDAEAGEYDLTYARGADGLTLPVFLVVGRVSDRASIAAVAPHTAGSGPESVKQALEGTASYTAFDTLRVTGWEASFVTIGGVDYRARKFMLDIAGTGA